MLLGQISFHWKKHSSLLCMAVSDEERRLYVIYYSCRFHKHFTQVTYVHSSISWHVFKNLACEHDGAAYFASGQYYKLFAAVITPLAVYFSMILTELRR